MRHTKHRQEILDLLRTSKRAFSARAVHNTLPHINLVTIYRNLEKLTTEGLVRKLYLDSSEAVFEYQDHPHHHAICTDCREVLHFTAKTEALVRALDLPDFDIEDIEITVRGRHTHKSQK